MPESFSKTYQKAQSKVILRLVIFFLFLSVYFVGMIWFFDQPFFLKSNQLEFVYLMEIMIEAVVVLLDFFVVAAGRSYSRGFLWILVVGECLLPLIPMYLFFYERSYLLLEFAWFLLLSLKAYCFYLLANWMNNNEWADFYFINGKTRKKRPSSSLEQSLYEESLSYQQAQAESMYQEPVYEPEPEEIPVQNEPPVVPETIVEQTIVHEVKVKKVPNYSQLAIRLGIMIYGQLVVFPMIIQVFQDFFVSVDNRYVFGMRWMFNDCLTSALLWTWSLFFLFLNMKSSKKVVTLTFVLQAIATLFFMYDLYTIFTGATEYPLTVYIYLIILDVIRLTLITWAIAPVYLIPVPEKSLFTENPD